MPRIHTNTRIIDTYEISAKSLQKGDSIWVGKRVHTVASNKKLPKGRRLLRLTWGSHNKKDEVVLSVSSKLMFSVTKHQTIRHTK